jgi:hypothetical protein
MSKEIYTGTYKVVKQFKSGKRELIRKNLTIDEARSLVSSYPSRSKSMVIFLKQFSAQKYYKIEK